jgi:amino acid adenylation domain-containing protein
MDRKSVCCELDDWARRTPTRTAVLDGRQSLTYAELAAASGRLALALRDAGVGPGDKVAFSLQRSVRCVTALLGILRAGAVYVPIDPKAPTQRTAYVLEDCRPAAVVCESGTWPIVRQAAFEGVVIDLGDFTGMDRGGTEVFSADPSLMEPSGDDLAYVLYTSGSTGHPKGVMVTHANIRSYTDWAIQRFSIGTADRILGTAPFHFDMSTFDIFCSLRAGATLCIASETLTLFPEKLVQFMEKEGITLWKGVSSLLMYLARAKVLRPGRLPALCQVLFGGEALPTRWLIEWMRNFPEKEFFNVYGPTEATGISLYHAVEQVPAGMDEKIPIGLPCSDTCVYLLDEEMREVADGETGELYIGGAGVTNGYLNATEKTVNAFLPDPYRAGERIYRTGDLARRRPDGKYEFIGRRDHQVKVMGYRIELGEIEHALLCQPGVREAAVALVPAGGEGLEELVAFMDSEAEPAAVLEALKKCLPAYMVPRRLLPVGRLPRCGRGKIDRFALPALIPG